VTLASLSSGSYREIHARKVLDALSLYSQTPLNTLVKGQGSWMI
jgi:hypothetical protein